jgi:hypothetical protein
MKEMKNENENENENQKKEEGSFVPGSSIDVFSTIAS